MVLPGPQQWWNPPSRRKMVLIHVVQDLIIQRDQVLQLALGETALCSCDVGESVEYEDATVLEK